MRSNALIFVMYFVRTGSTIRPSWLAMPSGPYPVLHTAVPEFATFLPPRGADIFRAGQRVRGAHSLIAECADYT